jgi:hypothetical protein
MMGAWRWFMAYGPYDVVNMFAVMGIVMAAFVTKK